ncbi:MAG: hypothetical protein NUV77_00760 [Thermoguttaceae bacterium]|jgi:signal transduction histidine kinase|nr:hypothetical protein [Thermoguttaceae bacterium]
MTRQARLTAIEAVPAMSAALVRFGEDARAALAELDMAIRRAVQWIEHDQSDYWQREIRRGWDRVTEARNVLEAAKSARRFADHEPTCLVEQRALEAAQRRLRLAQDKASLVQRWARELQHELAEYRGATGQLAQWLDADLPRATAALARMTRALEAYVEAGTPAEALPAVPNDEHQATQPPDEDSRPCESAT